MAKRKIYEIWYDEDAPEGNQFSIMPDVRGGSLEAGICILMAAKELCSDLLKLYADRFADCQAAKK